MPENRKVILIRNERLGKEVQMINDEDLHHPQFAEVQLRSGLYFREGVAVHLWASVPELPDGSTSAGFLLEVAFHNEEDGNEDELVELDKLIPMEDVPEETVSLGTLLGHYSSRLDGAVEAAVAAAVAKASCLKIGGGKIVLQVGERFRTEAELPPEIGRTYLISERERQQLKAEAAAPAEE